MALSADGKTALIGGSDDDGTKGAAWVFSSAPPAVSALSPAAGPAAGGTLVTISGSGFTGATAVKFGSAAATLFNVVSDSGISAVAPPGQAGSVDVTVTGPTGTSAISAGDKFTYTGATTTTATTTTSSTDTTPPSAPGVFRGRYAAGALLLTWHAAADNVGVGHYELYGDGGVPLKRISRTATSASIRNLLPQQRLALTLRAFDAAGNRSAASNRLTLVPRRRPAGVPLTIPAWAPKLFAWETHGRHGKRPATPRTLPAWYARWTAWQLAPYKITR